MDTTCYHEFCRLLTRLKSNYQLGELVQLEEYSTFTQLVAQFTVSSLQSWQFSANSIHYLLSLWQRLVASLPYLRAVDNVQHHLDAFVPEVGLSHVHSYKGRDPSSFLTLLVAGDRVSVKVTLSLLVKMGVYTVPSRGGGALRGTSL